MNIVFLLRKTLFAGIAGFSFSLSAGFQIAENGIPQAEIIIQKHAGSVLRFAAEELQTHIKMISGAQIPISSKSTQNINKIILAVKPAGFLQELEALSGTDGYAIRKNGNTVTILGCDEKGVLNGVYRWLFDNTDIIWARPNREIGTIFTPRSTLVFHNNHKLEIPAFLLRGYQTEDSVADRLWATRNCQNLFLRTEKEGGYNVWYGWGHSFECYLSGKFDSHPEWFAMVKGKRVRPEKKNYYSQPCYTNQEMTAAITKYMLDMIKKNPQYKYYRLGINDNTTTCECKNCMTPIILADGTKLNVKDPAFASTRYFLFMNQVAKEVHKHYPDKYLLAFAYYFTETAPKIKLDPAIAISFAPIERDSCVPIKQKSPHDIYKKHNMCYQSLKKYKEMGATIFWREYYGLYNEFPRSIWKVALQDYQTMLDLGINLTYSEMLPDSWTNRTMPHHVGKIGGHLSWDFNIMNNWIIANGSWEKEPLKAAPRLQKEFLTRTFGNDPAPYVGEFFEFVGKLHLAAGIPSYHYDSPTNIWMKILTPDVERKLRTLLINAENAGVNEITKRKIMLRHLRGAFEFWVSVWRESQLVAVETVGKPFLTADFQDPLWKKAPVYGYFRDSKNQGICRTATELRILYDQENIYIGVKAFHNNPTTMAFILPPKGKRKNLQPEQESFEIFLKNKTEYTHIVVNPVNVSYTGGSEIKWTSEARPMATGWNAVITIPWKALGQTPGSTISAMFIRNCAWKNVEGKIEKVIGTTVGIPHKPESFPAITFIHKK